ncbi:MAG: hypothetical protein U0840_25265 [Gemmataceae bacterium]
MVRLILLLSSPLLLAFAPAPVLRPMADPDGAVAQFETYTQARTGHSVDEQKRRLLLRLEVLQASYLRQGKPREAETVRERILLVESMEGDRPLGHAGNPREVLRRASLEGKYRHLLHVLYVPADRSNYNEFADFGPWTGSSYLNYNDLKQGHWVYSYPRWFIWRDGPPQP